MLVLLPPSEGKTPAPDGAPADLAALHAPELADARSRVLDALVAVSARADAAAVLRTGPSLAAEVRRNTRLRDEPAAPARHVYSGVLYAAAGLGSLDGRGARRADDAVRTVSALWGLVAPSDRIPAYRLSMGTDLPGIGPLARFWRGPLGTVLDAQARDRLVVDCRSAGYAAAWTAPAGGPGVVEVRVLRESGGRRTVVSHAAKHTRGVLTRHLLTRAPEPPTTAEELLAAAGELVGTTLLDTALDRGRGHRCVLSVVVA